ncbi:MAG: DNA gyrase inhibitor YacG [Rhodospirillales bacterium]|nr:DNA gyrase inhibitor YacG [Rhodospirillales bacterium]MDE0373018.1 DNA gyrase inhibitor YacG [Rhodospirillales bacterium]MXX23300.1 DNA gyrase inhibitor YacG [Rhodospirillales bacterium]MYE18446.1 DNA gyrase inhibitor YacG [Rhodospirillales bacterium]
MTNRNERGGGAPVGGGGSGHAAPQRQPPCPVCRRPADPGESPFCSVRCRQVDLHRWLSGGYVIPGADDPGDDS